MWGWRGTADGPKLPEPGPVGHDDPHYEERHQERRGQFAGHGVAGGGPAGDRAPGRVEGREDSRAPGGCPGDRAETGSMARTATVRVVLDGAAQYSRIMSSPPPTALADLAATVEARGRVELVPSVCPHDCTSTCALEVERQDARTIGRVRGSMRNTYTAGVICEK